MNNNGDTKILLLQPEDSGIISKRDVSVWSIARTLAMLIVFSSSCFTLINLLKNYWQLTGKEKTINKKICFFSWKKYLYISKRIASLTKTELFMIVLSRHTTDCLSKLPIRWM